ncbi:hypothetical protein EDD86DRAFT_95265 [Gorgonomyces haynaldii]|nr:hypothetical protein EDD86DRAFT_95265 [Gorgonomyces haynaldii]
MKDEDHIARQRKIVDDKYGPGAFDRAQQKIKPHRCHRHLDDMLLGLYNLDLKPMPVLFQCFFSEEGKEPKRVYHSKPFSKTQSD